MENHFHLVAVTPEGDLSRWMHQLKTAYTVYFNRRHQVVGHLFQGRFKSTVIEAEKYLLEVSRYLYLNPVRGVVLGQGTPMERRKRLREYRWSSYRGYGNLSAGTRGGQSQATRLVGRCQPDRAVAVRARADAKCGGSDEEFACSFKPVTESNLGSDAASCGEEMPGWFTLIAPSGVLVDFSFRS